MSSKEFRAHERYERVVVAKAFQALLKDMHEWYNQAHGNDHRREEMYSVIRAYVVDLNARTEGVELTPEERAKQIENGTQKEADATVQRDHRYIARIALMQEIQAKFTEKIKIGNVDEQARQHADAFFRGGLIRTASLLASLTRDDLNILTMIERLTLYGQAVEILYGYSPSSSTLLEHHYPFDL